MPIMHGMEGKLDAARHIIASARILDIFGDGVGLDAKNLGDILVRLALGDEGHAFDLPGGKLRPLLTAPTDVATVP